MAWTDSRIFRQFLNDALANANAFDLSGTPDTFKAALYNNTGTPSKDSDATGSTYNGAASAWVTANEVIDSSGGGTDWPAGGVALGSPLLDIGTSGVVKFDANDTASGATADIASAFGCLVYDTTVSSRGVCFNYFGGSNSVTGGTFTIVWNASGIFTITV